MAIKEQKTKLFFNQLKTQRETKFKLKIKDDRDPQHIALNLVSKKDVLREYLTNKHRKKTRNEVKVDKKISVMELFSKIIFLIRIEK